MLNHNAVVLRYQEGFLQKITKLVNVKTKKVASMQALLADNVVDNCGSTANLNSFYPPMPTSLYYHPQSILVRALLYSLGITYIFKHFSSLKIGSRTKIHFFYFCIYWPLLKIELYMQVHKPILWERKFTTGMLYVQPIIVSRFAELGPALPMV